MGPGLQVLWALGCRYCGRWAAGAVGPGLQVLWALCCRYRGPWAADTVRSAAGTRRHRAASSNISLGISHWTHFFQQPPLHRVIFPRAAAPKAHALNLATCGQELNFFWGSPWLSGSALALNLTLTTCGQELNFFYRSPWLSDLVLVLNLALTTCGQKLNFFWRSLWSPVRIWVVVPISREIFFFFFC